MGFWDKLKEKETQTPVPTEVLNQLNKPKVDLSFIKNFPDAPQSQAPKPSFWDRVKAYPQFSRDVTAGASNVAQEVVRGSARGYAALGSLVGKSTINYGKLANPNAPDTPSTTLTPQGDFQQALYGTDKPITLRSVGEEVPFVKEGSKFAPAIGFALSASDLIGGGGTKSLINKLAKETDAAKIAETLRNTVKDFNGNDEIVSTLSENLARETDTSIIQRQLDYAVDLAKKKNAESAPRRFSYTNLPTAKDDEVVVSFVRTDGDIQYVNTDLEATKQYPGTPEFGVVKAKDLQDVGKGGEGVYTIPRSVADVVVNNNISQAPTGPLRSGQPPIGASFVKVGDEFVQMEDVVARERFDIPNLKKVSFGGSDRDVYDLGDGNVLKVAKTSRGLDQNQYSTDWYAEDAGLIPATKETGSNYVVKEMVDAPDANVKAMVKKLKNVSGLYGSYGAPEAKYRARQQAVDILNEHGYPGDELLNYGDILWGDMTAIRNWGTKDGKPIMLDEGTLNGNLITNASKNASGNPANLQDPTFRAIYDKSRAARKAFGDTDNKTMYAGAVAGVEDTDGDGYPDDINPMNAALGVAGMAAASRFKKGTTEGFKQADYEVVAEMTDLAQAGQKIINEDGTVRVISSTFPKWIPDVKELRTSEVFQRAIKHYEAGTEPAANAKNVKEVLEIMKKEIAKRASAYDEALSLESAAYRESAEEVAIRTGIEATQKEALSIRAGRAARHIPEGNQPQRTVDKMSSLDATIPRISEDLNLERMAISPEAKATLKDVIADVKPQIESATGKKLTNQEAIDYAKTTSEVMTKAIGKEKTLEWEAAMLNTREKLARLAETGIVNKEYIETLMTVKTLGTDIGRKLQSLSMTAQPKEAKSIDAILEAVFKSTDNADEVIKAAEGVDFTDFKQASEFYRQFIKPTAADWLDLLRYNSMLSSPLTHIVNIFSNLVNSALVGTLEKLTVGMFDLVRATTTGTERKVFAGEAGVFLKGYIENTGEAVKRFGKAVSGETPITNLDVKSIPLATEGLPKAIENALAIPMRVLEASDQFFTALTEGGEKAALAYRASKGVKVRTPLVKAQEGADYRLYRQELFPEGQGTLLNAVDSVTATLYSLRESPNPIISNVFKFTVPFIRTPTNIFKQGLEYSPTGYFTLIGATDKQTQLAKAAMGTALFAGAAVLVASKRLTWAEPVKEDERNAFRDAGMLPYSVKIGDTWVQYQKLPPPLAFPLSMVALLHTAEQEKKIDTSLTELILSSVAKYGDFLADQSYAKSIGDLLSALQGGESDWARVAGNVPQQLVPYRALGGWLARLTDDVQRKPDPEANFVEKQVQLLMMNIPGLSDNVPARENAAGEPIKADNNIINALSPLRSSTENARGKKTFENLGTIKELDSAAKQQNNLIKEQAERTVEELKSMTGPEKKARLVELLKANPVLGEKVLDLMEMESYDYTPSEKRLKEATVAARAEFIAKELKELKTPEEKKALLSQYAEKKILTDSVLDLMLELQAK